MTVLASLSVLAADEPGGGLLGWIAELSAGDRLAYALLTVSSLLGAGLLLGLLSEALLGLFGWHTRHFDGLE
jgi:hypothetical protein